MKYKLLLFDADETLFNFEESEKIAFSKTFSEFNLEYNENNHLKLYKKINGELWLKLEKEEIELEELKKSRFKFFFEELGIKIDYEKFNNLYMENLGNSSILLDDTLNLLKEIDKKYKMAIITNGFTNIQSNRIKKSEIAHFFDDIFISEEIGFSKPESEIFEYSVRKLGGFEKNEILMIGDNLVADIMGGLNFGVDTCWVNLKNKENNKGIVPKYEINNLLELLEILN